jgi:Domain of unknown function (DUF4214)
MMANIIFKWDGKSGAPPESSTDYFRGSTSGYFRASSYEENWAGNSLSYDLNSVPGNPYPISGIINRWAYQKFDGSFYFDISDTSFAIPTKGDYSSIISGLISGKDTWYGSNSNDFFYGSIGGDRYVGSGGIDTIDMFSKSTDFISNLTKIIRQGSSISIENLGTINLTLDSVERIRFSNISIALDTDGAGGQAYRIYKAAFNRTPDTTGLGYWIAQMDKGMNSVDVAARFIDSSEFRTLYGQNPSNADFLTKVYTNVLGRTPDQGGFNWWLNELNNNPSKTKAKVLADFSESAENQTGVASLIGNGITYEPWVG